MKKLYAALLFPAVFTFAQRTVAQINLDVPNGTYKQNFDGMEGGTTLPTGWTAIRFAGSGAANATLVPTVSDGSGNSGNIYNVGTTGEPDRALGTLASGSTVPAFGASFRNNTGSVLGSLSVSGNSEQWRGASNSGINEVVVFEYSLDATSLNTGTWTAVPSLDLQELLTGSTAAAAVNGNLNRMAISATINSLNLPNLATIWFRWRDADNTGSDGLYALDDFSLDWTNVAVANTVSVTAGNGAAEPSTNGSFLVSLNNPAPAGGVMVNYSFGGSATPGADYTDPQGGSVTIAEGNTSATIAVTVADDALAEPNETITITLTSVTGGYSISAGSASISLADNESSTLYSFGFAACTAALSDGFTQQSVTGAQTWACTTFGRSGNGVQMNGFATTAQENVDWLISPALDLSGTNIPLLQFWSRSAFSGAPLQLFITTNFTGDAATTTWTELAGAFPATGSDVWKLSENINLSAYKQANVHLAFRYTSTTSAASRWTLDDISIVNSATLPVPELLLKNGIIDFRYISTTDIAIGKPFTFAVSNASAPLTITAPENFLLSKNNFTYSQTLTYTAAELNAGQRTAFVGFRPTVMNTVYAGLLRFNSTGIDTTLVLAKGNTWPLPATLNVVNWNIEWFGGTQAPADDNLQEQNVRKAMNAINADVYALSEIVDTARLGNLVRSLDSSYRYVVSDYASLAPTPADPAYATGQKLALVYKTSVVSNVSSRGLLKSSASANGNWASGRVPFLVNTRVSKAGATKDISFLVLHGKAGSTQSDYQSRVAAVAELKDTLDAFFNNRNLIILGDFNDDLDQSIYTGGGPVPSSYDLLVKDSIDADHYKSPTLLFSQYGMNSTADFPDVIDHVVVSNEVFPSYLRLSASLYNDLDMLTDITDFANTTSDHYPVLTRYFLAGVAQSPLPVKLLEFTGTKQGDAVRLSWKTAQEQNSKEFVVERSANGVSYAAIGKVAAAGNSSAERAYQLIDARPQTGANFYRLVSVDQDGKKGTSKVVRVDFGRNTVVTLWPNPARTHFTVTTDGNPAQMQLMDMAGRLVRSAVLVNPVEIISTQGLSKGTYVVRVVNHEKVFVEKLVIE